MGALDSSIVSLCDAYDSPAWANAKKADVVEYLEVFGHVGLLVNRPPGTAELPLI
jgi:hypothetical protein